MTKKMKFRSKHTKKAYYKKLKQRSEKMAKNLQKNVPKSEIWFIEQLNRIGLEIPNLKHNELFELYIPDFRSDELRLIIEVDGDIHELEEIKQKDINKTKFYNDNGYKVIRVVAYDENSLNECFKEILTSIEAYKSRKPKVIKKTNFKTKRISSMCYVCQTYSGKHKVEIKGQPEKLCGYCIKNYKI